MNKTNEIKTLTVDVPSHTKSPSFDISFKPIQEVVVEQRSFHIQYIKFNISIMQNVFKWIIRIWPFTGMVLFVIQIKLPVFNTINIYLIYSSFYVNNNKFAIEITIKNNQIKSIFKATQYVKISFEIKLLQKGHVIPVISL